MVDDERDDPTRPPDGRPVGAGPDGARHVALAAEQGTWKRWSVLLPALAFVAGLLLGGAVIGVGLQQDHQQQGAVAAGGPPTPTPSASPSGLTVDVPGSCLQAANKAEDAYGLVEKGVAAARGLDARALADLVDQAQRQRPEVQRLIDACRAAAQTAVVEPSPTPDVTPSAS